MKKFTKTLSMVLLIAMCMSMFAGSAYAANTCGGCGAAMSSVAHSKAATCTDDGYVTYYTCVREPASDCGAYHLDMSGANFTYDFTELEVAATGHSMTHHAAKAASCQPGNAEYYSCSRCSKNFEDEAGLYEITTSVTLAATGVHTLGATVPEKAPTCNAAGNIEYAVCTSCGAKVVGGTSVVTYVELPATGNHTYGDWIVDKAATAYDSGIQYRVCTGCGDIETENVDAEGVKIEDASHYIEHIGPTYWKSGMDPLQFYSNYYDIYAYSGTLKIDGKTVDRESYWANNEGVITLGNNLMSRLSAGKHTIQVVDTSDPRIDSNTLNFTIAATLKASDTDKHVINSSKSLKFVASDDIVSAKVGSIELTDKDDFKISGKTITLYADFLNKRTAGSTYTLTVTTKGGETASTTFKILTTAQASASPRTGDDSNIALWSALVLMSGAAMVAVLPRLKKEQ